MFSQSESMMNINGFKSIFSDRKEISESMILPKQKLANSNHVKSMINTISVGYEDY